MVVNVLLNQIKSSLSKSNLGVPAINKSQILVVSDELIDKKLPSIYFIIQKFNSIHLCVSNSKE